MIQTIGRYDNTSFLKKTLNVQLFNKKRIPMKYILEYIDSKGILFVKIYETMETKDIYKLGREVREKAYEKGYKLVFDFTDCSNSILAAEACYWFPYYYEVDEQNFKKIATALIKKPKDADYYKETEFRFRKNNLQVKIFSEKQPAIEWLAAI